MWCPVYIKVRKQMEGLTPEEVTLDISTVETSVSELDSGSM